MLEGFIQKGCGVSVLGDFQDLSRICPRLDLVAVLEQVAGQKISKGPFQLCLLCFLD